MQNLPATELGQEDVRFVLDRVAAATRETPLAELPAEAFNALWLLVGMRFPGLHPDGSLEEGSDWPEEFIPLAREAFRRVAAGNLSDEDLYWSVAVAAFVGQGGGTLP